MNRELDEQLVQKYPKIFRDRNGDMRETLMCWGFDCGDGWYHIINSLCWNIQEYIDWSRSQRARALRMNRKIKKAIELNSIEPIADIYTGEWWTERCEVIVKEKKYQPVPDKVHQVVAVQVKEKFGSLRFYYNGGDSKIDGMVRMAESISINTCEVCGNKGKLRRGGWIRALCDEHAGEKD